MLFPNIIYALGLRGLAQYQLADRVGVSESRLSRCMRGRLPFTQLEAERITSALGFPRDWLFARPTPPAGEASRRYHGENAPVEVSSR